MEQTTPRPVRTPSPGTTPRCEVRRGSRSAVHLYLTGDFDHAAHAELRRSLRRAFDRAGRGSVVVDMSGVGAIGSECIEVLLVGYTRAMRGGHGFEVVNAHGPVRQALAVTGLCEPPVDDMFDSLMAMITTPDTAS
ncbi:STAS domain-containing protein [Actinoplanes sp. DH11]|uniref:STAS domain-containing protein n=1 Tax=Actinoplanes sp. DH11 TaxID=2857011 RepID=UPI001E45947C|nr:STAS domain-containing protein [Actinoplanes sp. DH11]